MPCHSGYEDVPSDRHNEAVASMRRELDRVSAILCRVMRQTHGEPVMTALLAEDVELRRWWDQHQKLDRAEGREA